MSIDGYFVVISGVHFSWPAWALLAACFVVAAFVARLIEKHEPPHE